MTSQSHRAPVGRWLIGAAAVALLTPAIAIAQPSKKQAVRQTGQATFVPAPVAAHRGRAAMPQRPAAQPASAPARPNAPTYGDYGMDTPGMDMTVAPGDDFYDYANGNWAKTATIPADKSGYGMFSKLDDLSKERTRGILESAVADPNSRIGNAYASFLDQQTVEKRGMAPIAPLLNEIRAIGTKADYFRVAGKTARIGVRGPFGGGIGQDDKAPDTYIVGLGQSGLGLPDRDYYLVDKPQFAEKRPKYLAYLQNMLTLAGETNVAPRAQAIYDMEKRIAEASWTRVDSRDATKTYNKMTVAQLQQLAPGFDFSAWLAAQGLRTSDVLVAQPTAFTGIAKVVAETPIAVLKDQMLVNSLAAFSSVLPEKVASTAFAFYGTALSGVPQMEPRWKRAVNFTVGGLSDDVSKIYVQKYYPPETKAAMDDLVKNVVAAMGRRIDNVAWMQPETKVKARAKLAAFTTKIGYPDRWQDYSSIVIRRDDLFGNAMRIREWAANDEASKLGTPIRRWEWGMTPMTINAYANFGMNEIVFPAAIIQPPFFDPKADPAINYGGIGAVIGHEISHHFDDQGAKYDASGRLTDWWTPADVTAFTEAGKQLVAQYSKYEPIPGQFVKGELTLGENIGDLAGLAVAYDAYKASLNGKPAPVINGTTGDQRFFLGWAQVWRRKNRPELASQLLTTDPHSPSHERVWSVRNQNAWYDAFGVRPGQKMYLPTGERVRVW